MRLLVRNQREFYVAETAVGEDILDEYGNITGEYDKTLNNIRRAKGNISSSPIKFEAEQFGIAETSDKVILMHGDCDITEQSVLWLDSVPVIDKNNHTDTPYDYIVKSLSESLTGEHRIVASKVKVQ